LFAGGCSNAYAGMYAYITITKSIYTHISVKNTKLKKI